MEVPSAILQYRCHDISVIVTQVLLQQKRYCNTSVMVTAPCGRDEKHVARVERDVVVLGVPCLGKHAQVDGSRIERRRPKRIEGDLCLEHVSRTCVWNMCIDMCLEHVYGTCV